MTGSEDERPDAEGIRPLKAAIRNGRVYLDMVSLVEGYRARADALEERGYHDVAALYRREADELDTAAIGWLSEGAETPTLTEPPAIIHVTKSTAEQLANHLHRQAWAFAPDEGAVMAGRDPAGNRVSIDIHVEG